MADKKPARRPSGRKKKRGGPTRKKPSRRGGGGKPGSAKGHYNKGHGSGKGGPGKSSGPKDGEPPQTRSKNRPKEKGEGPKKIHCPGLEYLKYCDTLIMMQEPELIEILTGWSTANQYVIHNKKGQQIYVGFERTDEVDMFFREENRSFIMHILDNSMQEVLRILRDSPVGTCACGQNRTMHIDAESPPGQYIGSVEMSDSCCVPEYILLDHKNRPRLMLKGENSGCFAEFGYAFDLMNLDGAVIGQIYKEFSNIVQEAHTNADNYILKFPKDLSVPMKALVIGAALQIDYIHFEQNPHEHGMIYDNYHYHHHHCDDDDDSVDVYIDLATSHDSFVDDHHFTDNAVYPDGFTTDHYHDDKYW